MKKIFAVLIVSALLPLGLSAQSLSVSIENARIVAEKFYSERSKSANADQVTVISDFTVGGLQPFYYAFNISKGGFVIVSANKATPPVLCYSFTGRYSNSGQPDNFKAWMGQYERQISYAQSTRAAGSEENAALWDYYLETPIRSIKPFDGREVLPLTSTTWDQGVYYDEQCPADPAGPGGHCVTGCVATALGQLMDYFRWPGSGIGSYSYDCPGYGTLSVDFSQANYDWDLMASSLENSTPEVAELLYNIGVSVDMQYGPDGSGMYNHKGAYTLRTYFKYSPETQYVFRDTTTMDWDSLLVTHLDKKIPMYYAGWSVPDTSGHGFICDGYQGEGFYHFNWGWSGSYDGYFYTDNLTPGGNIFNLAQELIINAVPDTNLYTYPPYCEGEKSYTAMYGTIEDGSGPMYSYETGASCNWLITPNDSVNGISLDFLRFSVSPGDTVFIYDGPTDGAPLIGAYSGNTIPPVVNAEGDTMLVVFNSTSDSTGQGFLAAFNAEIPVYCSGIVMLSEQTGTLTDGSGNWDYHNNSACLWRIMPTGASSVTLYFSGFETEETNDVMKIYDLQTGQVLAEYSGSYDPGVPGPVTSPSGKMFITFNTNYSATAPGWSAWYESNLVGIPEKTSDSRLVIYPNPTDGNVTVKLLGDFDGEFSLGLMDISGRMVYSGKPGLTTSHDVSIGLGFLSPGIYIMKAQNDQGISSFTRISVR